MAGLKINSTTDCSLQNCRRITCCGRLPNGRTSLSHIVLSIQSWLCTSRPVYSRNTGLLLLMLRSTPGSAASVLSAVFSYRGTYRVLRGEGGVPGPSSCPGVVRAQRDGLRRVECSTGYSGGGRQLWDEGLAQTRCNTLVAGRHQLHNGYHTWCYFHHRLQWTYFRISDLLERFPKRRVEVPVMIGRNKTGWNLRHHEGRKRRLYPELAPDRRLDVFRHKAHARCCRLN